MNSRRILALALAVLMVGACANYEERPRQTAGTLIGAAAGGLAGAQFGSGSGQLAATALGVFLGGMAGSEIGRQMDENDRLRAQQAHQQALNTGQTVRWDNPNSGNHGAVVPTRTGTNAQTGQFCREFQTTIVVGGREEDAYGTACQQPDGSWKIIN